jgi:hypothetical protein
MAYLVGVLLALFVARFAHCVGLDRDRAFYPTVLVVVASLYDLFAVMAGALQVLGAELVGTVVFVAAVVVGFRRNLWVVAAALAAHGLFDLLHPHVIDNPGVPAFWPAFCMSYDVTAALVLAWLLHRHPQTALRPAMPAAAPAQ